MTENGTGSGDVRETPKFTGVRTHRDEKGRYSVRFATDWQWFTIDEPIGDPDGVRREGIGAAPNAADPSSALTMWVTPLETSVTVEDLADLREGVDQGLVSLEGSLILSTEDLVLDNLIKFVRVYTFREGDATRKRQQWLLYVDRWLMCLTWQGSSVEEYDYWYAMANHTFMTMELPPELWFATDRDLAGLNREPESPHETVH